MSLLVLPAPMAGGRLLPPGGQQISKAAPVGTVGFPSCHRDSPQTWATSSPRTPTAPSLAAHAHPKPRGGRGRWRRARPSLLLPILRPEGRSCAGALAQSPGSHPSRQRTMHRLKNNQHRCPATLPHLVQKGSKILCLVDY